MSDSRLEMAAREADSVFNDLRRKYKLTATEFLVILNRKMLNFLESIRDCEKNMETKECHSTTATT